MPGPFTRCSKPKSRGSQVQFILGPHSAHVVVVCPPPSPPTYIFDSRDKVLEGRHYVCQYLEDPIFVDVPSLGSYSHRPRWIWTNLAPLSTLAAIFCVMPPPFDRKVDDILDPNRISLSVIQDDVPSLALVNKVGAPRRAFPTFMTSLQSFTFCDRGRV